MRNRLIVITPHQGLGDHLICLGIYRHYSKHYKKVLVLVKKSYFPELSSLFKHSKNVTFIKIPAKRGWTITRIIQFFSKLFRIKTLGLGTYGENFFIPNIRFDHNFYLQADVPFEERWNNFFYERDLKKEERLYSELNCQNQKYIFLHEDERRGMIIDRSRIPSDLRVIKSPVKKNEYNLVDFRKVIENASEIHVIESAFAAFIECLPLNVPLFAHRYARPEAENDFRHEFTYKKPWKIIY